MGAVKWSWVGALLAAATAVATVLLIAHTGGSDGTADGSGANVGASLDHTTVDFGDPVTATVTVTAPRDAAIRVNQDLAPLTQLGTTRIERVTRGGMQTAVYSTQASCLDDRCLARSGDKGVALRPAVVQVDGRKTTLPWPVLRVQRRVTAADAARARPPLRSSMSPPPVTYTVSPDRLVAALDVAAALLAAAGALLAGATAAAAYRLRHRPAPQSGLERALALAREAEQRPAPDRRRALGLLARLLGPRDAQLAGAADELAWSARAPTPVALAELVDEVEQEVDGR